MKKIFLLCALVCASHLYGMEPQRGHYTGLGDLPRETQAIIISYLQTNNNLDGTIAAIKEASKGVGLVNKQLNTIVNEVYGIPKGFTALVHMLAAKFNQTPIQIAKAFKTQTAKKYVALYEELYILVSLQPNVTKVKKLLDEGVDINAGPILYSATQPLLNGHRIAAMIALLLEHGANPYNKNSMGETPLERLNRLRPRTNKADYERAKALLKEAMEKYPPSHWTCCGETNQQ